MTDTFGASSYVGTQQGFGGEQHHSCVVGDLADTTVRRGEVGDPSRSEALNDLAAGQELNWRPERVADGTGKKTAGEGGARGGT